MQAKLKYKMYGEFSQYEMNELIDWFKDEISNTPQDAKSMKITIDWEPAADAAV